MKVTTQNHEIKEGGSYTHYLHGYGVATFKTKQGWHFLTYGGPNGDKRYIWKGIKPHELTPFVFPK